MTDDYLIKESDTINGHSIHPITLSAFLPDLVNQTVEENADDRTTETIQSNEGNPSEFTGEDFPPLPPPANLVPAPLYDQEYPPLSSSKTTVEEKPLSSSTTNEFVPSPLEDLLGNRTLFKQVKRENQSP